MDSNNGVLVLNFQVFFKLWLQLTVTFITDSSADQKIADNFPEPSAMSRIRSLSVQRLKTP